MVRSVAQKQWYWELKSSVVQEQGGAGAEVGRWVVGG